LIGWSVITIVITRQNEAQLGLARWNVVALKIRKVGNSLGLVLPKEVISRLRTGEGEDVFLLEGPNNTYRITPFDPAFEKKMEKAEEIMARYRNTLHVLAK
jgi:putative addiction module antidote